MRTSPVVLLLLSCLVTVVVAAEPAGKVQAVDASKVEFVEQVLEPTGGKIQRPKDWFYKEGTKGASYIWIVAKEDPAKGPYTTGVKIQLLSYLKKNAGKTPKEFILNFIAEKKKEAGVKVLSSCEPSDQELFTRVCLETEEGGMHLLYSMFWGRDNLDIAVVMTSGAPKDQWETYWPVFSKMRGFELIDMKRFEGKVQSTAPAVDLKKEQFVGQWRCEIEGGAAIATYREDGTFSSVITQEGKASKDMEGTWRVENGAIYLTPNTPKKMPGDPDHIENEVTKIGKYSFVIGSEPDALTYERIADVTREQLTGTWRYSMQGRAGTYVYKPDGTYTSTVTQGSETLAVVEGTWHLEGGVIYMEKLKSTNEKIALGKSQDVIVEIGKDYYVLGLDSQNRKYERVVKPEK